MNRNQSNIGLNHGAGKGDKDRTSDRRSYEQNYDEINWHREIPPYTREELENTPVTGINLLPNPFRKHLEDAAAEVVSWPEWKQNLIKHSPLIPKV